MLKRILLATDGSPSALAAARFVASLSPDGHGLDLDVIYVMPHPRAYAASRSSAAVATASVAVAPEVRAAVDDTLAALGPLGASAHVQFATGLPAEEIVACARRIHADLIVVGKRGRHAADDLLLGSVCQQVLLTAPCAVAVAGQV
ncbi:MAG TPA: universal stress protein [Bacillota bacterium]|nr:universal stress protein [Bacillota bacterium]